jgi:hypothetical protein
MGPHGSLRTCETVMHGLADRETVDGYDANPALAAMVIVSRNGRVNRIRRTNKNPLKYPVA